MSENKVSFNTLLHVGTPVLAIAAAFYALKGQVDSLDTAAKAQQVALASLDTRQRDMTTSIVGIGADVRQLRSLLYEKRIIREAPLAMMAGPKADEFMVTCAATPRPRSKYYAISKLVAEVKNR